MFTAILQLLNNESKQTGRSSKSEESDKEALQGFNYRAPPGILSQAIGVWVADTQCMTLSPPAAAAADVGSSDSEQAKHFVSWKSSSTTSISISSRSCFKLIGEVTAPNWDRDGNYFSSPVVLAADGAPLIATPAATASDNSSSSSSSRNGSSTDSSSSGSSRGGIGITSSSSSSGRIRRDGGGSSSSSSSSISTTSSSSNSRHLVYVAVIHHVNVTNQCRTAVILGGAARAYQGQREGLNPSHHHQQQQQQQQEHVKGAAGSFAGREEFKPFEYARLTAVEVYTSRDGGRRFKRQVVSAMLGGLGRSSIGGYWGGSDYSHILS
jgi:hypothetical protein